MSTNIAKSRGTSDELTDTDIVDGIALLLGTNPVWSSPADFLESIANLIGRVRRHPGDQDPVEYVRQHADVAGIDPFENDFLRTYIGDEANSADDADSCPVCGETGYDDPADCTFCQDQA